MQFNRIDHLAISQEHIHHAGIISVNGFLGGIDRSDVPYIYHHLRTGCVLTIHSITGADNRHIMFGVNYGSYRLGILNSYMAKRIAQLQASGSIYRITISQVVKEKYLPPTAIVVNLEYETATMAKVA